MKRAKFFICFAFIGCLLCASQLNALINGFQPVVSLPASVSPRGIAVGNVFGNDAQNLIVANFGSSTFIGQSTPASLLNSVASNVQVFSPSSTGLQLTNTIPTASSPRGLCLFNFGSKNRQDIFVTAYDANLLQIFDWAGGQFLKIGEAPTLKMPVGITAGLSRPGGLPFVVVADYGSNSLSLFSLKDGKLGNRVDIPVDEGPTQVAIGDLSGSGLNEIAVVCLLSNKIDILATQPGQENNLSSFTVIKKISLPDGSAPADLRITDLNNDGLVDLVVANFAKNAISIYMQQKDGSLLAQPILSTSGSHPNGLTAVDLYGNGDKEIIVANRDSDSLDLFLMTNGQYQLTQTLKLSDESGNSFGPIEIGVLDTRGVGTKDLVVSHMRSNTIKVLPQSFSAAPTPTAAPGFLQDGREPFSEKTTYCYPNPTHDGNVKFSFTLDAPSPVVIQVFDVEGEKVWGQTLSAGQTQNGINNVAWSGINQSGQNLASGIYIYSITVGGQTVTKKLGIIH